MAWKTEKKRWRKRRKQGLVALSAYPGSIYVDKQANKESAGAKVRALRIMTRRRHLIPYGLDKVIFAAGLI
jgi:hypothetical protein